MQVKALVPLRSVRMLPAESIAMTVASLDILAGAARIALLIICGSVGGFAGAAASGFLAGFAASAAMALPDNAAASARAARQVMKACSRICPPWSE